MATMKSDDKWEFLKDCRDKDQINSDSGNSCLEQWEEDKKLTENELNKKKAEAAKAEANFTNATTWEAKLKLLLENIKASHDLADAVYRELVLFKSQVDNVCKNARCTTDALEILYNDVLCVFNKASEIKYLLGGFPGIEGIIEKIDKLEDPGLPKDKGIRKCLEDFRAKLAAVVDMQTEAFKKVLEALKCANLLLQQICEDQNGLISNVEVMVATFGVGGSATTDSESATSSSSCRATLAPKPKFPIETSRYYLDTLKEHSDAYTEKGIAKTKYDQARNARDVLQACYDSLCMAIEASKSAKNCK